MRGCMLAHEHTVILSKQGWAKLEWVGLATNDECSWQAKYSKIAGSAREIFAHFDPDYESYTLDEAYLDVTDHAQLHSVSGIRHSSAAHTWTSVGRLSDVIARPLLQECIGAEQDVKSRACGLHGS